MIDIMELPAAIVQPDPTRAGEEAKCSQPDLLRLLAISCLGKAIYQGPWFDVNDAQMSHCATITNVTRNIDHLTTTRNLPKLLDHVQQEYGRDSLVSGLVWTDDKLMVRRNGDESEITSSHIKGEAYEILCAIVFKGKAETPLNIKNYYHELPEDCGDVECRVNNVFLSEKSFSTSSLHWCDNEKEWGGFKDRITKHLKELGGPEPLVEQFGRELTKNIEDDLGFDLLVELKEFSKSNEESEKMHLILAQCKYRSNQFAEVNMSEYIGKYYPLVHLLDQINSTIQRAGNSSLMLCPFFWMSTQLRLDPMNYFSTLCSYGRVKFYGNMAMGDDHTVCNLIHNIEQELTHWIRRIRSDSKETFKFQLKSPREPRSYQTDAINSISSYFSDLTPGTSKHASVIMATGSGKTLTSFLSARKLQKGLQKIIEEENIAASLHLSPMIRLVMQNAHEWLAEELSREKTNMSMIYYCVCSLKKEKNMISLSGCTAVRLITSENMFSVFRHHKENNTLHRCRFFTTYQGGKVLIKTMRKINLELYGRDPTAQLFGVTVRDEAHTAVGRGSKSYAASLYLPTYIGLSFTASPKYEMDNVETIFPKEENQQDQESSMDKEATYLSLPSNRIFPQIDIGTLQSFESTNNTTYNEHKMKQWSPLDLLSENMLFCLRETGGQYDWSHFQKEASETGRGIVVFYVKDEPVQPSPDRYDIMLDHDGNPECFGVVGPSGPDQKPCLEIHHDSKCYGINQELNKLFVLEKERRGFAIHDMTGLGEDNRIGPVIHKLGYKRCMDANCLVKPRLMMLKRRIIAQSEYQKYNIDNIEYLDAIFGKSKQSKGKQTDKTVLKSPHEVSWRLTICGNVVDGTAHQFRAMNLLLDCFMLADSQKPIKTALVFCSKTEESKICKSIFDALLEKYARKDFPEPDEFFTGVIYTSDVSATDEEEFEMSYGDQQDTISSFCQARRGVLFNVKLVGIGVDLPSIDAALIVNPGKSPSDITQKDGRALRVDQNVADKIATVIVPSWDFSDAPSQNDAPTTSNGPSTPAASELTEGPSIMEEDPQTPLRTSTGLASAETPVNSTRPQPQNWTVPVKNAFEEMFWLQVRILKAMMDPEIEMITSIIEGSLGANASGRVREDSVTTAKALLQNIMGDSKGKPHVPVYDESFSEFLIKAWECVHVDINSNPRDPRARTESARNVKREQRSRIFMLVACCACCHHHHRYKDYEFGEAKETLFWSPSAEPFQNRMSLDAIRDREASIDWNIVGLASLADFEKAIHTANGTPHTSKKYKTSFDDLEENEKNTIIEDFLKLLEEDVRKQRPTILEFMQIVCESLPVTGFQHKFPCHQDTHNLADFGLEDIEIFKQQFQNLLNRNWMKTVRKEKNGQSRSTGTKRVRPCSDHSFETGVHDKDDDDDAITSPQSQPDHIRNVVQMNRAIPSAAGTTRQDPSSNLQSRLDAAAASTSRPPP